MSSRSNHWTYVGSLSRLRAGIGGCGAKIYTNQPRIVRRQVEIHPWRIHGTMPSNLQVEPKIMNKEKDFYIENIIETERNRRNRIAASFAPILLAAVLLVYPLFFQLPSNQGVFPACDNFVTKTIFTYAPVALIVIGLGNLLYWYLQTGFDSSVRITKNTYSNEQTNSNATNQNIIIETSARSEEILAIKLQLEDLQKSLDPDLISRELLVAQVQEKIETEAGQNLLNQFREQCEREIGIEQIEQTLNRTHATSAERLRAEIESLGRRGNVNLALGVITTLVGLILLTVFIFKNEDLAAGSLPYAINFLPRLTLVIFIEVFAYFFLRLYKASLAEIKYFQNELTNLESKHIALLAALRCENGVTLSKVIEALAKTERNQLLEKGQSTIDIQKMQLENNQFAEVAKTIASLVPKSK